MAQSVKRPTHDLGPGQDLTVNGIEPHIGGHADGVETAWNSLSLPLPLPLHSLTLSLILFLKVNK